VGCGDPSLFVPEAVDQVMSSMAWMYGPGGYFDVQVRGWENLPARQGLVVMNHSGGTSIPDVLLASSWAPLRRHTYKGPRRRPPRHQVRPDASPQRRLGAASEPNRAPAEVA